MTDNEIIKALECCVIEDCGNCPVRHVGNCIDNAMEEALALINRQKAEIEELNECYTNLSNASLQHIIDNEKDRQLLGEYQNIFLDLGFGLEISDPELKEIKAWKDRMIWHCKKADELLTENNKLKAKIENLIAENSRVHRLLSDTWERVNELDKLNETLRAKAIKAFAENLAKDIKSHRTEMNLNGLKGTHRTDEITYQTVIEYIDNCVKEMVGEG